MKHEYTSRRAPVRRSAAKRACLSRQGLAYLQMVLRGESERVVDDHPGDVLPGCVLDAFKARARVDLHYLGPLGGLEHVNPGHLETNHPGGIDCRLRIFAGKLDRDSLSSAMEVGSKLPSFCPAAHRAQDPIPDHQRPDIAPLRFLNEFLKNDSLAQIAESAQAAFN